MEAAGGAAVTESCPFNGERQVTRFSNVSAEFYVPHRFAMRNRKPRPSLIQILRLRDCLRIGCVALGACRIDFFGTVPGRVFAHAPVPCPVPLSRTSLRCVILRAVRRLALQEKNRRKGESWWMSCCRAAGMRSSSHSLLPLLRFPLPPPTRRECLRRCRAA